MRPTGPPRRSRGCSMSPAREDEAIRLLDGCMTRLHEVQQAKAPLKGLTACELREALEFRHQGLRGEPA